MMNCQRGFGLEYGIGSRFTIKLNSASGVVVAGDNIVNIVRGCNLVSTTSNNGECLTGWLRQ